MITIMVFGLAVIALVIASALATVGTPARAAHRDCGSCGGFRWDTYVDHRPGCPEE